MEYCIQVRPIIFMSINVNYHEDCNCKFEYFKVKTYLSISKMSDLLVGL